MGAFNFNGKPPEPDERYVVAWVRQVDFEKTAIVLTDIL